MNRTFAFEVSFVGRLCKNLRTLRNSGELNRRKSVTGRSWKTTVNQILWRQGKWRLPCDGMCLHFLSSFVHSFIHLNTAFLGFLFLCIILFPKTFFFASYVQLSAGLCSQCFLAPFLHSLVIDDAFRHWWRPCWRPWSMMPLGSMLTSMIKFAARDPIDIHGQVLLPEAVLMSIIHTATGNHIEVLFSLLLLLGDILMSVICSAPGNHVDGDDLCCCWLSQARKLLLQWYWWLQTPNWEREALRAPATTSATPPSKKEIVQTRSYWRESSKPVIKMLKCGSSQLIAFGSGWVGEGLSFL